MEKDEKPLLITSDKKNTIKFSEIHFEKKIVVESVGNLPYLLFCYQEINLMYGLSSDDINTILYLKELWIFSLKITVLNTEINLKNLLERDYIRENYSNNNKKLYSLSEKGNNVITDLSELLLNTNNYISANRQTDLGLNAKMKSILSRAYDK